MSLKLILTKMLIKWMPTKLIVWVANIVLKGIAELINFSFDLDTRKVYVQVQLAGESDTIEVWLEDFAIIVEDGSYQFILQDAKSNKLWMENLLSRVVKKSWKIPVPPQMSSHMEFAAELLKVAPPEGHL